MPSVKYEAGGEHTILQVKPDSVDRNGNIVPYAKWGEKSFRPESQGGPLCVDFVASDPDEAREFWKAIQAWGAEWKTLINLGFDVKDQRDRFRPNKADGRRYGIALPTATQRRRSARRRPRTTGARSSGWAPARPTTPSTSCATSSSTGARTSRPEASKLDAVIKGPADGHPDNPHRRRAHHPGLR